MSTHGKPRLSATVSMSIFDAISTVFMVRSFGDGLSKDSHRKPIDRATTDTQEA